MSTARSLPHRPRYQHGSGMAAADRGRLLSKLADAIEANAEEFAQLESLDTGHPIKDCPLLDVPRTAACFRYFGGIADKLQGDVIPVEPGFLNYVQREPLGVVGQIVPWNFPLMFCSLEDGARAGGRQHSGAEAERADAADHAAACGADGGGRLPAGVVNIVPGYGHTAGERLGRSSRRAPRSRSPARTATGRRIVECVGRQPEARAARARRQGRQHRVRRRGPAGGGQRLRLRDLPQPGPGVHRRQPLDPARDDRRRIPRSSSSRWRARSGSATRSTRRPRWAR